MVASTQYVELMDALQIYFQVEKIEALVFVLPLGLLSILFSAWSRLTRRGPCTLPSGQCLALQVC